MSTSPVRNTIVASLWEWAELNGDWGKLLVHQIVETGEELSETKREEIFQIYLYNNSLGPAVTIPEVNRPEVTSEGHDVVLLKISEVKGVNRLAENQTLEFSENITVIYGENGTGKSGYSRILKIFADCYDSNNNILSDAYADTPANEQSVKISYKKNGQEEEFIWNGQNNHHELHGISAFNNHCVELSLNGERGLLVKPSGFNLFALLSVELDKLRALSQQKTRSIELPKLEWRYAMQQDNPYYQFIQSLSYESDVTRLDSDLKFTDVDKNTLLEYENELKGLNEELLRRSLADYRSQILDLSTAIYQLSQASSSFGKSAWDKLLALLDEEKVLSKSKEIGLTETMAKYGIEKPDSPEFIAFITSADKYLKHLEKHDYPSSENDACIYCQQKLVTEMSRAVIEDYKKALNDDGRGKLKNLQEKILVFKELLKELPVIKLNQASFGTSEDGQIIQPTYLEEYNILRQKLQEAMAAGEGSEIQGMVFSINYLEIIANLTARRAELAAEISSKNDLLGKLLPESIRIKKVISDLKAKEKLAEMSAEVRDYVTKVKYCHECTSKESAFNTAAISRRTTQVREATITTAFVEKFNEELRKLKPSSLRPISFNFRTERGDSVLGQAINSHKLVDIFSEGEQKAIALAEFLSEIQLDGKKSPVIFDDPVTSLDHHITWEVAKRLVKLSRDRQVVVFTHSLILLNNIKQVGETEDGLQSKYYRTEKNTTASGILFDEPTLQEDKFNKYKAAINRILGLSEEERNRRPNELAVEGYNKLRAAIEVFLEDEVFKKVVKRYKRNVVAGKIISIQGALIDDNKEEINSIFERCCEYTDAHSSPDEAAHQPSLEELRSDLQAIEAIYDKFHV